MFGLPAVAMKDLAISTDLEKDEILSARHRSWPTGCYGVCGDDRRFRHPVDLRKRQEDKGFAWFEKSPEWRRPFILRVSTSFASRSGDRIGDCVKSVPIAAPSVRKPSSKPNALAYARPTTTSSSTACPQAGNHQGSADRRGDEGRTAEAIRELAAADQKEIEELTSRRGSRSQPLEARSRVLEDKNSKTDQLTEEVAKVKKRVKCCRQPMSVKKSARKLRRWPPKAEVGIRAMRRRPAGACRPYRGTRHRPRRLHRRADLPIELDSAPAARA